MGGSLEWRDSDGGVLRVVAHMRAKAVEALRHMGGSDGEAAVFSMMAQLESVQSGGTVLFSICTLVSGSDAEQSTVQP